MQVPKNMDFPTSASIPEAWLTAYQLLFKVAEAKKGETALVLAAASGVGSCLLQLCKFAGIDAIAVSSCPEKLKICKDLGAFDGINYKQVPEFSERVKLITDGAGADIILDPVMASMFDCNLDSLAMDGRWVIYGFMGGPKVSEANFMKLLLKRGQIKTTTLRSRTDEYKSELIRDMLEFCTPGFESGALAPLVDRQFPMSKASEAMDIMQQNLNIGKIVLINDLH